jgi:hypothetical protein
MAAQTRRVTSANAPSTEPFFAAQYPPAVDAPLAHVPVPTRYTASPAASLLSAAAASSASSAAVGGLTTPISRLASRWRASDEWPTSRNSRVTSPPAHARRMSAPPGCCGANADTSRILLSTTTHASPGARCLPTSSSGNPRADMARPGDRLFSCPERSLLLAHRFDRSASVPGCRPSPLRRGVTDASEGGACEAAKEFYPKKCFFATGPPKSAVSAAEAVEDVEARR